MDSTIIPMDHRMVGEIVDDVSLSGLIALGNAQEACKATSTGLSLYCAV